jgi:pilus assembly protein Flp/PilA
MTYLNLLKMARNIKKDESGATAIEYGLIAALIAVIIIGAVALVGTDLSTMFQTVSNSI